MIKNKETPTKVVKALNAWQIYTNPLRYMTKPQLDQMFDYQRHGNDARLQIAFYEMERTMPIYGVCLSKRLCAIHDKKWRINPTNPSDPSSIQQAKKVHKIFEKSDTLNDDGLTEAIRHLGLASFRGRSVVKAFIEDNHLIFKKIENWNVLDWDGKYWWNPDVESWRLPENQRLQIIPDDEICAIREERPIDIVGLTIYLRQLVGEENWARFVEKCGVPQVVITMPEGTPETDAEKWRNKALAIFEGGSGVIPFGAEFKEIVEARNQDPFTEYCHHQSELICLLALGGSLSTVGGPTGLGSNLAEVQNTQFQLLVNYDCKRISNALTSVVVKKVCEKILGEYDVKCRFDFVEDEAVSPDQYLDMAIKCTQLGIPIDCTELKKLTGLTFIKDVDTWSPNEIQTANQKQTEAAPNLNQWNTPYDIKEIEDGK